MAQATLAGHPLHPILICAPAALLPFSLVMDIMHAASRQQRHADAAYYALVGGCGGAVAAAAAGAIDYFGIPREHPATRTANIHAAMNVGLLALFTISLALRGGRARASTPAARTLSLVGNLGLLVSAWYGGDLVYRHGLRVRGVNPLEGQPHLQPPGDRALERLFEAPLTSGSEPDAAATRGALTARNLRKRVKFFSVKATAPPEAGPANNKD